MKVILILHFLLIIVFSPIEFHFIREFYESKGLNSATSYASYNLAELFVAIVSVIFFNSIFIEIINSLDMQLMGPRQIV